MDLQIVLAANVLSLCLLAILPMAPHWRAGYGSWILVNLLVAAIVVAAWFLQPDQAGYIAIVSYVVLFVAPFLLRSLATRRAMGGRWAEAARFAGLAAILHPAPDLRHEQRYARAMVALQDGDGAPMAALAAVAPPALRQQIAVATLIEQDRWTEMLALLPPHPTHATALATVRGLAETGRLDEAVAACGAVEKQLPAFIRNLCHLWIFAFAGRPAAVEILLRRAFPFLSANGKDYCRALAATGAGDAAEGRRLFADLAANGTTARTRVMAARHLEGGLPPARPNAQSRAILDAAEAAVVATMGLRKPRLRDFPVAIALVLANSAAFVAEWAKGGTEDGDVLIDLGALWPPLITEDGEYWRLLTAAFLHYGPIHFTGNLLMLAAIGAATERILGSARMAVVYLSGAIGVSAFVSVAMQRGWIEERYFLGASGALFALMGAETAFLLSRWRKLGLRTDLMGVAALIGVIAFQLGFDQLVPVSSSAGHVSGFVIGFVTGAIVLWLWPLPPALPARSAA